VCEQERIFFGSGASFYDLPGRRRPQKTRKNAKAGGERRGSNKTTANIQKSKTHQLHVLAVDAQHLEAARLVGDADVDLAVEAAEAAQRGVDRVGAVAVIVFLLFRVWCGCLLVGFGEV
jgi:hypothetical protein